jgi:NTE family protein
MPKAPRNAKPTIAATGARAPVLVDLALQGGGSHGAFTWGVLDRLLEEPWLDIEAVSGTSRRRPARRWTGSGPASPAPPASARSSARPSTRFWADGRWTIRRCTSPWI